MRFATRSSRPPVAHADETSLRGNGNLYWLPVLSTNRLTAYSPQPKRGAKALIGVAE